MALALTALNAVKPVTVDDPAYLLQAAWWAAHPLDPLGGEALLYQSVVPSARVASPPVGIAWLALGMRVVGPEPWALKLWLFPFAVLLCWALDRLLRRLSPEIATPLLAMSVLSPLLLPSFNLMLDLPALSLATAAVAVSAGGADRNLGRVVLAGLLAGLALQTKYTAAPTLIALFGVLGLAGRAGLGIVAMSVALATFAGIEAGMLAMGSASPLGEYLASRAGRDPAGHWPALTAKRLVLMFGSVACAWIPIGLLGLGARRGVVLLATALPLAGFTMLAFAPSGWVAALDGITRGRVINFENVAVGWMGPVLLALALPALGSAFAPGTPALARALALWFVAECAIAPFVSASASVRRVIGATVALSLLLAWQAGRRIAGDGARFADVVAIAAAGILLGLVFWSVDLDSAIAESRTLAGVRARTGEAARQGRLGYVTDHWGGFQYEAARAGWVPVSIGRSNLSAGDWLVIPFGVEMRGAELDSSRLVPIATVPWILRAPLTTRQAYYDGRIALRRPDLAWIGARVDSVTRDGPVLRSRPVPR